MNELVTVCVLTYKRPAGLQRLLDGLDELKPVEGIDLEVVVVDNDPDRAAEGVVAGAQTETALRLRYEPEPQRGITYARNRALQVVRESAATPTSASGVADWIVWMDDDEVPNADWLQHVIETQRATDADVVIGPSKPVYEPGGSPWIIEGGFHEPERFATGKPFPYFHARTSGVLIRFSEVPDEGFDNRLALVGGEDSLFFTRMQRAGASFIWDDRAVMNELVPASRISASWLLRRWYRVGVSRSLILLYLDDPGWPRRLRRVAGGAAVALRGLARTALAVPKGRIAVLGALKRPVISVGSSVGALGISYNEYRKTHGS